MTMTTQKQVRAAFWRDQWRFLTPHGRCTRCSMELTRVEARDQSHKCKRYKSQNDYPADVRMAFCDYVDSLARDGQISESLAQRVTL